MDILNPRIGEIYFTPKNESPLHADTLAVKPVLQRIIPEKQDRQQKNYEGTGKDAPDNVELKKHWRRFLNLIDICLFHLKILFQVTWTLDVPCWTLDVHVSQLFSPAPLPLTFFSF
jgi:hypothetical protein